MVEEKKEQQNIEASVDFSKSLEEAEKQKSDYLAGWQRARADFINYKKEETQRFVQTIAYANEGFIFNLLPVLDNFLIAEKNIPEELKNNEVIKGFTQIQVQLEDFLKNQGVEVIETVGKPFDLNFHEIVGEHEAEKQGSGIIVEEIQRGYLLSGKVIRPAKVKVAK
ncbi:MAG: nucleotide exchange factor GrpE [bacterium]